MNRLRFLLPLFCAIALGCFTGCTTAPVTGRQQFNIYSPSEEAAMGLSAFADLKQSEKINTDPQVNAMVERVGKRIAAAAAADLPNAQWEFVVFDDPQANAFCLPGGKVGVYTGILPITKNEAGLATVLGHEVAHAAAHHGGERMTAAAAVGVGQAAVSYATKDQKQEDQALWNSLYTATATVGAVLPHSRVQESEADRIGLTYMARAGYDPEAAVAFWERFAEFNKAHGSDTPWFLRTHPLDEKRIEQIKQWIPEARLEFHAQ